MGCIYTSCCIVQDSTAIGKGQAGYTDLSLAPYLCILYGTRVKLEKNNEH